MQVFSYPIKSISTKTKYSLAAAVVFLFGFNIVSKWLKQRRYFKKLNIPGPKPLPLVGNMFSLMGKGFHGFDVEVTQKYGNIVGYFEGDTPIVLCNDIELMKRIYIKDFNNFSGHRVLEATLTDPMDRVISVLHGDEWKNMRSIVSAAFTVGKVKLMSSVMIDCADELIAHMDKRVKEGKKIDTKDTPSVSVDKIFESAFLLKVLAPKLAKYLADRKYLYIYPKEALDFFVGISRELIRKRRSGEDKRNDFIQTMVEHEANPDDFGDTEKSQIENLTGKWNQTKKTLSDKEILAQSFIFYIAGYETTASTLSFLSYNLALNQDCQDRLYSEIFNAYHENHEVVDYDFVNRLEYLDMCIQETLRMYPPALRFDRVASEDYKYNDMLFPKGIIVTSSPWAMHHDPAIYPEPEKFDPERFSMTEKSKRDNMTLIPFGAGPRICVGMKFALVEMKLLLVKMLLKYEICQCEQTPVPLVMQHKHFLLPTKPVILDFKARQ